MNVAVLSKYDVMTVGEGPGISLDNAQSLLVRIGRIKHDFHLITCLLIMVKTDDLILFLSVKAVQRYLYMGSCLRR